MLCISSPFTEPYFNLATEEFLLQHFTDDIFMLWRNEPAIIVGKFQNTAAEINLDFVKEKHIKVVRRLTGGGSVFHDLGNLNYTFIEAGSHRDFKAFTEPIIAFLQSLGVAATFEGRNAEGEPAEIPRQGSEVGAQARHQHQRPSAPKDGNQGIHRRIDELCKKPFN